MTRVDNINSCFAISLAVFLFADVIACNTCISVAIAADSINVMG